MNYLWCDPAAAAPSFRRAFPQAAAECLQQAEEICRNRFTFRGHWEMERTHEPVAFPNGIVWDETPNGDPEWVFAFNRHTFLVTLGQAWRLTGKTKYADAAARLLEDWIDRVPLTEAAKATTWRPIEAGLRCETWLRALGLLSPGLDSDLTAKAEACLRRHAEWLLASHTPFQKLSNWGVLQDHGLLLLGLALGEPAWRDTAAARLEEQLGRQVLADGVHWEQSPLYHCEVLHCCLDSLQAAQRVEYELPEAFVRRTRDMAAALGKMLRPDGLLFCQSDSDEVDARDLLALAATLFGDPALKGYAQGGAYAENHWDIADRLSAYESLAQSVANGSAALADSGNYMLRDSSGPDAGMLHFHCGALGSGHGHADLLHVDLVCRGETILADSGRYTYREGALRRALKSPAAHNTVLVDNADFTECRSSWDSDPIAEPLKGEYRFTPHVDYVSGAHLGYLKNGVLTRRRVLRLGRGLWVLWDDFHVADAAQVHRYDRYYHFAPEGEVRLEGNALVFAGDRSAARLLFPGDGLCFSLEAAPVSREYNRMEEGNRLRVRAALAGNGGFATVIATGDEADGCAVSAELLPVRLVSTGEALPAWKGQGMRVRGREGGWTVLLLHTEVISEVSLLEVDGCAGYGKVLVFGPPCPDGLCMAW